MGDFQSADIKYSNRPLKAALSVIKDNATFRTILHSDQGRYYQYHKWVNPLIQHGIFQSMSRKGTCLDNSPMGNFFGILKQETYYSESLLTYTELKQRIDDYIYYYNHDRIKQKLSALSPVEYRKQDTQLSA